MIYWELPTKGAQLGSMVEVFYVLTTISSKNGNARGVSVPKAIRRDIVHALTMGPCSFFDRVAERGSF